VDSYYTKEIDKNDADLFTNGLRCLREPNYVFRGGQTLLMAACHSGRKDFVTALIQKGADVNVHAEMPDWWRGMTEDPIPDEAWEDDAHAIAIKGRYPEIIGVLFAAGAKPGGKSLVTVQWNNNEVLVGKLPAMGRILMRSTEGRGR
jgi:hypothetical protein